MVQTLGETLLEILTFICVTEFGLFSHRYVDQHSFKFALFHLDLYFKMLSCLRECSTHYPITIVCFLNGHLANNLFDCR